jgi:hypothetical protein
MFRRGDPRWNRTLQNISHNIEHANESTQEHLYSFTHSYVNPCLSSVTACLNTTFSSCFPSPSERRRNRRYRGRAEASFDFYDDWEEDENDGLLGWGGGNEDFGGRWGIGGGSNYGSMNSQPGRPRGMSYGNRQRDPRFNAGRRKSAVQPHDGGPDPTIIPSSSYFGFLGRLPFKIGNKVLRYKPSAADLTEHPGQTRRSLEEEQPLIEDSEEESHRQRSERKGHRRQRSDTNASGRTTDSLSSRGDIFPSEDELDDAVPLDDEFTMALERRTTSQFLDDTSSGKTSGKKNKRSSGSRVSSRTASSRNTSGTHDSGRRSHEDVGMKRSASEMIEEIPTMSDLKQEEERIRLEEEAEVRSRRELAQQLALKRGLASDQHLSIRTANSSRSRSSARMPRSPSSQRRKRSPGQVQMESVATSPSPLLRSPAAESHIDPASFSNYEEIQTAPDSGSFHVDDSDYSSMAPTPNRPLSLRDEPREVQLPGDDEFVPARLPHFSSQAD